MTQDKNRWNRLLEGAVDQAPKGIVVTQFPGAVVRFVNSEMERILGVSRHALEGRPISDGFFSRGGKIFYPGETAYDTVFFDRRKIRMADGKLQATDILSVIRRPDGSLVWAIVSTASLDGDHDSRGMVSVFDDVTDRKHELERLDYAVTASVDGLWDWQADGTRGYLSPRYYRMLDFEPNAFPPTLEVWKKMLHPDDRKAAVDRFIAVLSGRTSKYESEYRLRIRDGSFRWFRAKGVRVGNPSGPGGVRVVGTHLDITREREMEHQLQEVNTRLASELKSRNQDLVTINQRLETILDVSSESIWVIDGDGKVVRINEKSEQLLGIRADEVVGRHYMDLISSGIVDVSVTREALEKGRSVTMMQKALRTGHSLLVTSTPVKAPDGRVTMVIVNERDLTQLNRLQEELEKARDESSRMKEAMAQLNLKDLREQAIVAESKEMQALLLMALKLSRLNISTILILGESGTGKGLLARFIHLNSYNQKAPFVQINCAALPETLLEAELFGYEKGAFTGARNEGKIGLFEMAKGGTLFLDELGELSLAVQSKLLKCLEDKEIYRLGGTRPIRVDCTVIAATNVDLVGRVNDKQFRQDLFFRLNTFTLTLPPLRERPEDILELVMFFLEKYNRAYRVNRRISAAGLKALQTYPFPGNIRELKNAIKKSVVMSETDLIDDIKDALSSNMVMPRQQGPVPQKIHMDDRGSFDQRVASFEKALLNDAMMTCRTTREIARHLDMTQSQVVRKLKKHGLSRPRSRKKSS